MDETEERLRWIDDALTQAGIQIVPGPEADYLRDIATVYVSAIRDLGRGSSMAIGRALLALSPPLEGYCSERTPDDGTLECPTWAFHQARFQHISLARRQPGLASALLAESARHQASSHSFHAAIRFLRDLWRDGWCMYYYEYGLLLAELLRATALHLSEEEYVRHRNWSMMEWALNPRWASRRIIDPGASGHVYADLDRRLGLDMESLADLVVAELESSEATLNVAKETVVDVNEWIKVLHSLVPTYVAAIEILSELIAWSEKKEFADELIPFRLLAGERRTDIVTVFRGRILEPREQGEISTLLLGLPLDPTGNLKQEILNLHFHFLSRAYMPRSIYNAMRAALEKKKDRRSAWRNAWSALRPGFTMTPETTDGQQRRTMSAPSEQARRDAVGAVGSFFRACVKGEGERELQVHLNSLEGMIKRNPEAVVHAVERHISILADLVDRGHAFDESLQGVGGTVLLARFVDEALEKAHGHTKKYEKQVQQLLRRD